MHAQTPVAPRTIRWVVSDRGGARGGLLFFFSFLSFVWRENKEGLRREEGQEEGSGDSGTRWNRLTWGRHVVGKDDWCFTFRWGEHRCARSVSSSP